MDKIYIERWLTFTLVDGEWNIQLWADSAKPASAKVYRCFECSRGEASNLQAY
jgi:hypothetical protein